MNESAPFDWLNQKPDTLQYHLANPGQDIESYVRSKRTELGPFALAKRRIYLDTKHWVYLRDVHLGRPQKKCHVEIDQELRRLCSSETTICPLSYSVYSELLYQSDAVTRKATARVIDSLSLGFCLQPPLELFERELEHFFYSCTRQTPISIPVEQLMWTRSSFVLGDNFLQVDARLDAAMADVMAKAMDDLLWTINLEAAIEQLPPPREEDQERIKRLAATLTEGKIAHTSESPKTSNCCLSTK